MRSFLKYHGSKHRIAPWIISYMPEHSMYVEPFGGGYAVGLAKSPAKSEVYNDLNGDVSNLFRMVRERGDKLAQLIQMTPYSRDELDLAYIPCKDPLERARRFYVRAWLSIKTTNIDKNSGFRATVNSDDNCSTALTWSKSYDNILAIRKRLERVTVENCDAFKLFKRYDLPKTLWFLDPPYLNSTRSQKSQSKGYKHNFTDADHIHLLDVAKRLKGMVMISGYKNSLYDEMLEGWQCETCNAMDDNNNKKVECLWMNFKSGRQLTLEDAITHPNLVQLPIHRF